MNIVMDVHFSNEPPQNPESAASRGRPIDRPALGRITTLSLPGADSPFVVGLTEALDSSMEPLPLSHQTRLVREHLLFVAIKSLHTESIFPSTTGKPLLVALADELDAVLGLRERNPALAQTIFQGIGDSSLLFLALFNRCSTNLPSDATLSPHWTGEKIGQLAYDAARDCCQNRFPEHANTMGVLSSHFLECVQVVGQAIVTFMRHQRVSFGGRLFLGV